MESPKVIPETPLRSTDHDGSNKDKTEVNSSKLKPEVLFDSSDDEITADAKQQHRGKRRRVVISDDDDSDDGSDDGESGNEPNLATDCVLATLLDMFPDDDVQLIRQVAAVAKTVDVAVGMLLDKDSKETKSALKKMKETEEQQRRAEKVVVAMDDSEEDGSDPLPHKSHKKKKKHSKNPPAAPVHTVHSSDSSEDQETGDSDDEEGDDVSDAIKARTVEFFNKSTAEEMTTVSQCTLRRAKLIIKRRPLRSWVELFHMCENTKGLPDQIIWNCAELLGERAAVEALMSKCKSTSKKLKNSIDKMSQDASSAQPSYVPDGLQLKPYQVIGVNWLTLLHENNVNCILADEMGLGKTIQTIAFLARMLESSHGPHCVIVPSSTISNWRRELAKWAPEYTVMNYTGSMPERMALRQDIKHRRTSYDIMLSSYNYCISQAEDRSFFFRQKFHCVVFDEGHMVKNIKSNRYIHLMRLKARQRVLLTGTPLQNNLVELMSLLSFAMPSLFSGSREQIINLFSRKSNSAENQALQETLIRRAKSIVEPFTLRRLKIDVLSQLPAKVRKIVNCPMTKHQQDSYDKLIANFKKRRVLRLAAEAEEKDRQKVHKELSQLGLPKPKKSKEKVGEFQDGSAMSNIIMEMRKMACHPLLMRCHYNDDNLRDMAAEIMFEPQYEDAREDYIYEDMTVMSDFELMKLCKEFPNTLKKFQLDENLLEDSGKLQKLKELLPRFRENGDRILIFSQFVIMLNVLESFLDRIGIRYLRLDGSTQVEERQALIDEFNETKEITVFLLSTKAGGLGINLTSANICIIHDLDFNPQNDKQAEDRCHRVGQTKEVQVIRLICNKSIDEVILNTANYKLKLEQDLTEDSKDGKDVSLFSMLKQALA